MSATHRQVHTLTAFANVRDYSITYPSEDFVSPQMQPATKHARSKSVTKIMSKED